MYIRLVYFPYPRIFKFYKCQVVMRVKVYIYNDIHTLLVNKNLGLLDVLVKSYIGICSLYFIINNINSLET